jgi:hypothetical protein
MTTDIKQESLARWDKLEKLQAAYPDFEPFLIDCMEDLMGFQCSDIQVDIGKYLQFGPQYLMVQAQRSQAKSTIVAIYAVWCLIHDPKYRVLVISAGGDVALEIANWIIQIIMNWDILECMRPDRNHGDRASAKAFDIHYQLKGAEKSPSVACIGVTANMQGRRADLLIPDDIESSKNGMTEIQREQLAHLSKDFTSICQHGRICYMGTPQTVDSIYNALPGRGYSIRIWPGRYPTPAQMEHYGDHLAPLLATRILENPAIQQGGGPLGDQGQPIDPLLLPETALTTKELDQGTPYFQLQHMLNTALMDADRYPLKAKNLIVMGLNLENAPGAIDWMPDPQKRVKIPSHPDGVHLHYPFQVSSELFAYESRLIYVDPAGGGKNGDETVATACYFLHGYVFLMEQLALPGGYDDSIFEQLTQMAIRHRVNKIDVEANYGNGAFAQMWRPVLLKGFKDAGHPGAPQIEDIHETGQKELRIIDSLEPIIGRHRLIVNEQVWHDDIKQVQHYPVEKRTTYTLWNQMTKLSRDKNALIHDDRIDSLAGAVRPFVERIAIDEHARIAQKQTNEAVQHMTDWFTAGSLEERGAAAVNKPLPMRVGITRATTLNRRSRRRR